MISPQIQQNPLSVSCSTLQKGEERSVRAASGSTGFVSQLSSIASSIFSSILSSIMSNNDSGQITAMQAVKETSSPKLRPALSSYFALNMGSKVRAFEHVHFMHIHQSALV